MIVGQPGSFLEAIIAAIRLYPQQVIVANFNSTWKLSGSYHSSYPVVSPTSDSWPTWKLSGSYHSSYPVVSPTSDSGQPGSYLEAIIAAIRLYPQQVIVGQPGSYLEAIIAAIRLYPQQVIVGQPGSYLEAIIAAIRLYPQQVIVANLEAIWFTPTINFDRQCAFSLLKLTLILFSAAFVFHFLSSLSFFLWPSTSKSNVLKTWPPSIQDHANEHFHNSYPTSTSIPQLFLYH